MIFYEKYFSIELFLTFVKYSLIFFSISLLGFVKGLILFTICISIYHKILEKIAGAEKVKNTDKLFLGVKSIEVMTLCGLIDIVGFNEAELIERFRMAFKVHPKMNSKLHFFAGNYFWKKYDVTEERLTQLIRVERIARNYEHALKICNDQVNNPLNVEDKVIEFILYPYTDPSEKGNGCFMIKFDHSFSDGMNTLSLAMCLADNFSPDIFPKIYSKAPPTLLEKIANFLRVLVFGFYVLIKLCFVHANFKLFDSKERSGYAHLGKPQAFSLSKVKEIGKGLGATINEVTVSLISSTMKEMSQISTSMCVCIPVGNTKIPQNLSQVIMSNDASGVTINLPLISNLGEIPKISRELKTQMSKKFITDSSVFIASLLAEMMPLKLFKKVGVEIANNIHMTISNVAGPQKELLYCGGKVKSILPFNSTGPNHSFTLIFSYMDKIFVTPNFDKDLEIDPESFSKILHAKYLEAENLSESKKNK